MARSDNILSTHRNDAKCGVLYPFDIHTSRPTGFLPARGHALTILNSDRIAQLLDRLHREAETNDSALIADMTARMSAPGGSVEDIAAQMIADERADYRSVYSGHAGNFLAVTPAYGRFLYAMARAAKATRIVEFGTSMGISTVYLAAAIRDNGGGIVIGSELEAGKVARAREHLDAAGLADLVDIREGDALETLRDIDGEVDLVHLDGAWSLYLPVLKLIAPRLRPGTAILAENAFAADYLDYVNDPANGYIAQVLPIDEGRGNTFAVKVA